MKDKNKLNSENTHNIIKDGRYCGVVDHAKEKKLSILNKNMFLQIF
jgi:hypothetical protein